MKKLFIFYLVIVLAQGWLGIKNPLKCSGSRDCRCADDLKDIFFSKIDEHTNKITSAQKHSLTKLQQSVDETIPKIRATKEELARSNEIQKNINAKQAHLIFLLKQKVELTR